MLPKTGLTTSELVQTSTGTDAHCAPNLIVPGSEAVRARLHLSRGRQDAPFC
jgi:hypothetical protein